MLGPSLAEEQQRGEEHREIVGKQYKLPDSAFWYWPFRARCHPGGQCCICILESIKRHKSALTAFPAALAVEQRNVLTS